MVLYAGFKIFLLSLISFSGSELVLNRVERGGVKKWHGFFKNTNHQIIMLSMMSKFVA
jgi:hypothetical protein